MGSGEYLPVMEDIDRYLLANCGADGNTPKVVCLPTAAGEEGEASVSRWMRMGDEHFRNWAPRSIRCMSRIDAEADDPVNAELVANANFVYCSGGNPHYLYETLKGSRLWQAAEKAFERGAVYAGCSAGAMIMGEHMPDFRTLGIRSQGGFWPAAGRNDLPALRPDDALARDACAAVSIPPHRSGITPWVLTKILRWSVHRAPPGR